MPAKWRGKVTKKAGKVEIRTSRENTKEKRRKIMARLTIFFFRVLKQVPLSLAVSSITIRIKDLLVKMKFEHIAVEANFTWRPCSMALEIEKNIRMHLAYKLADYVTSITTTSRRMENDNFILGIQDPDPSVPKYKINPVYGVPTNEDFLLLSDKPYSYPVKLKRKSRLEAPIVPNACYIGTPLSGTHLKTAEKMDKENIICVSSDDDDDDDGDENEASGKNPSRLKSGKPDLKVVDISSPEAQKSTAEMASWTEARASSLMFGRKDQADKENNGQLKVVAPSFLDKSTFSLDPSLEFQKKKFNSIKQQLKPGLSGGGNASLKRPNSSSVSSLSKSSSLSGRKLQLLDQTIRLDEREKYSELLQSYTRVPVLKHSSPIRREKSPPISFALNARRKYGNNVEVIDLTSQVDSKDDGRKASTESETSGSSELKKKIEKCIVYDVSWIEGLTKMYNKKERETRIRIMEEKTKAALCSKRSEQLLNEILEERVRVHLRLTEVAVEEGPIPVSEDEIVLPKLTPEMEKQIAYAFKSGPGGEVLAEAFSQRITRRDMHTLVGTNWLNDEVINFYMNLLIERGKLDNYPSVYCFNTFFYPKLESQGHGSLKRWTRRVDIFAHDLLIAPIHLGVHWCLACINLKEKKILYFDSMGGRNQTCLQTLMKYLQDESMDKKKVKFDTTGWTLENVKDNPQQMNGSDCGMFSCMYAEYLCRKAKINFSQSDMPYFRRKMAYEILTKKLML